MTITVPFGYTLVSIHLLNLYIVSLSRYSSQIAALQSPWLVSDNNVYICGSVVPGSLLCLTDVMLWQEELNLGFVYTCSLVTGHIDLLVNGHSPGINDQFWTVTTFLLSVQNGLWHTQNGFILIQIHVPVPHLCYVSIFMFRMVNGQCMHDSRFLILLEIMSVSLQRYIICSKL